MQQSACTCARVYVRLFVCLWVRARRARSRWKPPAHAALALQVRSELRAPRCAALCRAESRGSHEQCVSASGGSVLRAGLPAALGRVAPLFADCRYVCQVRVGKFPEASFPLRAAGRKTPRGTVADPCGSFLKTQMQLQLGEVWFGSSPSLLKTQTSSA